MSESSRFDKIKFLKSDDTFHVLVNGTSMLNSATAQELVQLGLALRERSPMAVGLDAQVEFGQMEPESKYTLISGLMPSWATDHHELLESFEDLSYEAGEDWLTPGIDRGLSIDGASWAWFTPNGGDFQPVPLGSGEVLLSLWAS